MKIYVLDGAGTAGRTSGVIDHTVNRLLEKIEGTEAKWIDYPAAMLKTVGGKHTWEESSREGVRLLLEEMTSHDEKVILLAYSAGNKPLHDFLDMFPEFYGRIMAVGFISDPWRPRNSYQAGTPKPIGWGVMGERPTPIPAKSFWTSVVDDVISAAWPDALMRYVADTVEGSFDEMITEAIKLGRLGQFQLSWQLGVIQRDPIRWFFGIGGRIAQFGNDAYGYLSGKHTNAYVQPFKTNDGNNASLAERLGDTIAWKVRKDLGLV